MLAPMTEGYWEVAEKKKWDGSEQENVLEWKTQAAK
jgi:hypothetical protein